MIDFYQLSKKCDAANKLEESKKQIEERINECEMEIEELKKQLQAINEELVITSIDVKEMIKQS